MIALYAFKTGDGLFRLHACDQPADALQIAVAPAIELDVGDDAVLHLHIDVAGAGTLGLIGYFHCFLIMSYEPAVSYELQVLHPDGHQSLSASSF